MTMRERMASAVADIDDYDNPRPKHYAMADAMLSVLEEPSDGMCRHAQRVRSLPLDDSEEMYCEHFVAMIRAIRNGA